MDLEKVAQRYLDGERLRVQSIAEKDSEMWHKGNGMMHGAVKEFQKSKQSQEILFAEVEKLDKRK